ncbi:MAG: class I SAM-dependent methyltransferase [Anaerolineae bacterium]
MLRDLSGRYQRHVSNLLARHERREALELAVGGSFAAAGELEARILDLAGHRPGGYVIDVGCGCGRLAAALAPTHPGPYLGIDVVGDLVDEAARRARRPDWRFEVGDGLTIPEADSRADCVSFFSVFTHLPHEACYCYLQEARRVLRPGGRVVLSFLEFQDRARWPIFEDMAQTVETDRHHVQFADRTAIRVWGRHSGLDVVAMAPTHGRLAAAARRVARRLGHPGGLGGAALRLGQSVAVLRG